MTSRLESSIEKRFVSAMKREKIEAIKFQSPGSRGWPDRLVLLPKSRGLFIEFKRPGEKPRKLQEVRHDLLRRQGFDVQVFDDAKEAIDYVLRAWRALGSAKASKARS